MNGSFFIKDKGRLRRDTVIIESYLEGPRTSSALQLLL
jgi:hypothetical protein